MINKLILHNTEIHEDTILNFCSGVNFITGSSDNGKSTVVKAINWIVKNRPSGTGLVQRGKTDTKATIQIGRKRISREMRVTKKARNVNLNQYQINRTVLKAVSTKVPEEVSEALLLNDVNLQGQFETFFLLQDSPGPVAQRFNKVMGLDIIDSTMKKANSEVNKGNSERTTAQKSVENSLSDLESYIYLDSIGKLVSEAETVAGTIRELKEKIKQASRLAASYENTEKEHKDAAYILQAEPKARKALSILDEIFKNTNKLTEIRGLVDSYENAVLDTEDQNDFISSEPKARKALSILDEIQPAQLKIKQVSALIAKKKIADTVLLSCEQRLKKAEKEMDRFKSDNPLCPTCGKDW